MYLQLVSLIRSRHMYIDSIHSVFLKSCVLVLHTVDTVSDSEIIVLITVNLLYTWI